MKQRDLKIPAQRHPEKARRPDNAQPKKPDWIRVKAPTSQGYFDTRNIMREHKLVTVCEEAGCPNVGECWSQGHATMMIMGEVCTRACTFCNIATGKPPEALDVFEPGRVAEAVKKVGLNHVVITSVDRDDVEDGVHPLFLDPQSRNLGAPMGSIRDKRASSGGPPQRSTRARSYRASASIGSTAASKQRPSTTPSCTSRSNGRMVPGPPHFNVVPVRVQGRVTWKAQLSLSKPSSFSTYLHFWDWKSQSRLSVASSESCTLRSNEPVL